MATSLLDQLLAAPDPTHQKQLLSAQREAIDDALIDALKDLADQQLRADAHAALATAALINHAATLTSNPFHRALALFAEANAWSIGGLGDYARAIALCDEAAAIYGEAGHTIDQADAQVTKIFALAMLGRYEEALTAGAWAATLCEEAQEWLRLATVEMNVAIVYGRMGKDADALAYFEHAGTLYLSAGDDGAWSLPGVEMNRALVLRNLGRFTESMVANTTAIQMLRDLGQNAEVGHAQQTLAFTYYVQGRYNEALTLLDDAQRCFQADGRQADLLVTALYRSHCLLEMRCFADVIAVSDELAALAARLHQPFEEGHALLNKAVALAGLTHYTHALDLLTAARTLFIRDGNVVWATQADLEAARLLLRLGRLAAAQDQAARCATIFINHHLPIHCARAQLTQAEALLLDGDLTVAIHLLREVVEVAATNRIPILGYRAHALLGQAAEKRVDLPTARVHYDAAIDNMEQLRGRLMVEFRADFLADKVGLYAAAMRLCLGQGEIAAAHAYGDRARARSLQDLLALRLDLGIHARSSSDQPLVDELNHLRQARDLVYRRTLHAQDFAALIALPVPSVTKAVASTTDIGREMADDLTHVEERITALWHTLLVRNADYARDDMQGELYTHAVAQSRRAGDADSMDLQQQLPPHTLLLSYFVTDSDCTLFLISREAIVTKALPTNAAQIQRLTEVLRLNLNMAAVADAARMPALLLHAQKILHQLYQQLLAPIQAELEQVCRLIIVPHGPLHYVPFHALVTQLDAAQPTNSRYLLDQQTVSYLPGAALLSPETTGTNRGDFIAMGHSYGGQLPHAVTEAETIAALARGRAFVETGATKAQLQAITATARVLHLATHGDFRADNPLFSGLALDDGWLSTLDIFNLQTNASLVTLSACQTGRNVIGGGDELLGLMRAFLAAGAATIVMSLWAVHDESTLLLMRHFYQALLAGQDKGAALQHAQVVLRNQWRVDGQHQPYAHPYFWAPFLLVGEAGPL